MIKTLTLIFLLSSFGQDAFWRIYNLPTIPEKREALSELTHEEKVEVWRTNFALASDLTDEQREYLARLSIALPTMTRRELKAFETEAVRLFPVGGDLLFASIGPYKPCDVFLTELSNLFVRDNCPCSVGSKFNLSCPGGSTCMSAGSICNVLADGCGFLYLYSCNGLCSPD